MPTPMDQRRLRDGEIALGASRDLSAMTLDQLRDLRAALIDGAAAMQSLDDLGSAEDNEAAWSRCVEINQRIAQVEVAMTRLPPNQGIPPDVRIIAPRGSTSEGVPCSTCGRPGCRPMGHANWHPDDEGRG